MNINLKNGLTKDLSSEGCTLHRDKVSELKSPRLAAGMPKLVSSWKTDQQKFDKGCRQMNRYLIGDVDK